VEAPQDEGLVYMNGKWPVRVRAALWSAVLLILLAVLIFLDRTLYPTAGASHRQETVATPTQGLPSSWPSASSANASLSTARTVPAEQLKKILDQSFARVSAVYLTRQVISSAAEGQSTVAFVYYFTNSSRALPSLRELAQTIARAQADRREALALLKEARETGDSAKMRRAGELCVKADAALVQEKAAATIEVSPYKAQPPVTFYQPGLPDWLLFQDKALALARSQLGDSANVSEVDRAAVAANPIFVCTNAQGQTLYVDARHEQVFGQRDTVPTPGRVSRSATQESERQARIAGQWEGFLNDGIDPTQFSTSNLTHRDPTTDKL